MMRNQTILFLTLATISLPAAVTFGQQPASRQNSSQQTPSQPDGSHPVTTLKIKAREVVLPVTVRDKKGALVTSLKVSDFTLTEDGRPQTVKSFSRESNLPFRVGLLVDTSRSVSGAMDAERKAAGKFVDLMLPADPKAASPAQAGQTQADQAFLIHFDREVELLEDFTNSRDKLHRELDDMGATRAERSSSQGP
jgi:VWFA-related protein